MNTVTVIKKKHNIRHPDRPCNSPACWETLWQVSAVRLRILSASANMLSFAYTYYVFQWKWKLV